jgi:hypothetical protein
VHVGAVFEVGVVHVAGCANLLTVLKEIFYPVLDILPISFLLNQLLKTMTRSCKSIFFTQSFLNDKLAFCNIVSDEDSKVVKDCLPLVLLGNVE